MRFSPGGHSEHSLWEVAPHDPISTALAAAATFIGEGIAAAGAAIATISATTAFEVAAAVGAGLSVIGTVTKDKTLSMVGLAIGAIGGIGALASSAGLLGADAAAGGSLFGVSPAASTAGAGSAFGGVASDASSAATYGATSAFATGDAAGATAAATEAGTGLAAPLATANTSDGMVDFVAGLNQPPPSDGLTTLQSTAENAANPAALPGPRADGAGLLNNAPTDPNAPTVPGLTGPGTGAASNNLGVDVSDSPGADFSLNGQPTVPGPPDSSTPGFPAAGGTAPTKVPLVSDVTGVPWAPLDSNSGIGGAVSGILDFAKKNPVVALGALQAAGSFLSGATSTLTPAQVAYYNANAANNQAAANLATQQTRNLAAPKAVASLSPVTGAPAPLIPPTANPLAPQVQLPGLMNNVPPPKLAPVTGSVA